MYNMTTRKILAAMMIGGLLSGCLSSNPATAQSQLQQAQLLTAMLAGGVTVAQAAVAAEPPGPRHDQLVAALNAAQAALAAATVVEARLADQLAATPAPATVPVK